MFDIEEAKLPPPKPESSAMTWNCQSGVSGSCSRIPVPAAGMMSSAVVRKIVLRPPAMRMKKEEGMRRVAPLSPAMAARVKSSAWLKGNFRLIIWTVMIPQ